MNTIVPTIDKSAPSRKRFPMSDANWLEFFNKLYLVGTFAALAFGVEFDPSDPVVAKRAQALTSAIASMGLRVAGPIPTLPTPANKLPAYMHGEKGVSAPLRLTIGKK